MKVFYFATCLFLCISTAQSSCPQTENECVNDDTYVRHWITLPLFRPLQEILNSLTATQINELSTGEQTTLLPSQKFTIRYNLGEAYTKKNRVYEKVTDADLILASQVITSTLPSPFTGTNMSEYETYWITHWTAVNAALQCTTCDTSDFSDMELAYNDPEHYELHITTANEWKLKYVNDLLQKYGNILNGDIINGKLRVNRDPDRHELDRDLDTPGNQTISLEFPVSTQNLDAGFQAALNLGQHTGYMFASAITDDNDILDLTYGQDTLNRCVCVRHVDLAGLQTSVDNTKVDGNCNLI